MNFIEHYSEILKKAILECGYNLDTAELLITSRPDLGQFQCNDAMKLAKEYKKSPYQIAIEIVETLKKHNDFVNLNVAKPGFINISISDEIIIKYLNDTSTCSLSKKIKNPKKIFIDYGGANIAKTLHVGHIRSANIGEALKRLCHCLGHETVSDVHLGDWGLQIGMVIYGIKQKYPYLPYFDEAVTQFDNIDFILSTKDLETLYPIVSQKAKKDNEIMQEVKMITNDLQNKKNGYVALWRRILTVSKNDIKNIYDKLNVNFDLWYGESDAAEYIEPMLDHLKARNLIYESDGALIMDVSDVNDAEPVPPLIIKKSDGADLYSTTELASLYYRVREFKPDEIWYVVDNRQSLHFKQVFRAAYKSSIVPENIKLRFIGFGTMNGVDGKPFRTREGTAMTLSVLLDTIHHEVIKNLNLDINECEKSTIADSISIAVLKCADLITSTSTDYIFDPVKFSQLNGKTGVYLLYSALRAKSLLQKASEMGIKTFNISLITCNLVRNIILKMFTLQKILEISLEEKTLHKILEYLFEINGLYNNFYSKYKILTEKNIDKRDSWLFISKCVYDINLKLLQIVAINLPDKI